MTANVSHTSRRLLELALLVVAAGCGSKHIGRPCELGVDATEVASGAGALITSPVLECPSRVCLLPSSTGSTMASTTGATSRPGPLCTAPCETNDDCADAESAGAPGDGGCRGGFACGWPTVVGAFCCQKMCICRDQIPEPQGGFVEPAACKTPSGGCAGRN